MTIRELDALLAKGDEITTGQIARILADFFKSQSKHNAELRNLVTGNFGALNEQVEHLIDTVEDATKRSPVYQIIEEEDAPADASNTDEDDEDGEDGQDGPSPA